MLRDRRQSYRQLLSLSFDTPRSNAGAGGARDAPHLSFEYGRTRDASAEKVAALDLGADDYVRKPFDTDELLARVRVAMRHRTGTTSEGKLKAGPIEIDTAAYRVTGNDAIVHLTPKEFSLLFELVRHAGKVLTHRHLLQSVWGEAHLDDIEYLRVTMRGLRQKIESERGRPSLLINEPGIGYRFGA